MQATTVTTKSGASLQASGLRKQVSVGTDQLIILADIELKINAGESLAIVGASGSGKSTLLGLLAGLDVPSAGTVALDGQDIFKLDEDARARLRGESMGFVFQSFQLLGSLNALENVMLPLELAGKDDPEIAAKEILQRVGLADRLHHYPRTLSGGEQQRVAIARAFVTRPKVLLADEPTGNLDAKTGGLVADLLFDLNKENGTTLILVTHDLRLAERCAHRVYLEGGRIVREEQAA